MYMSNYEYDNFQMGSNNDRILLLKASSLSTAIHTKGSQRANAHGHLLVQAQIQSAIYVKGQEFLCRNGKIPQRHSNNNVEEACPSTEPSTK